MNMRRNILVVLLIVALIGAVIVIVSAPSNTGGSTKYTKLSPVQTTSTLTDVPIRTMSLVQVSQKTWKRKGKVRHVHHHTSVTRLKTRALSGPCYRVDTEIHGDSWAISHVLQGLLSAKLCMKAGNHSNVLDKYTSASSSHRESWLWQYQGVDEVKGAGVSTNWCNGGVGPCAPVEYRYWRFTFSWVQGVNVFGQTIGLHHKTLFIGCTLRAGNGGFHCGMGEA